MNYHPENAYYRIGRVDFSCGIHGNPVKDKHSASWEMWQAGHDSAEWNERYKA